MQRTSDYSSKFSYCVCEAVPGSHVIKIKDKIIKMFYMNGAKHAER